jgi:hypothetical protein
MRRKEKEEDEQKLESLDDTFRELQQNGALNEALRKMTKEDKKASRSVDEYDKYASILSPISNPIVYFALKVFEWQAKSGPILLTQTRNRPFENGHCTDTTRLHSHDNKLDWQSDAG